jgi:hypothetical protein
VIHDLNFAPVTRISSGVGALHFLMGAGLKKKNRSELRNDFPTGVSCWDETNSVHWMAML